MHRGIMKKIVMEYLAEVTWPAKEMLKLTTIVVLVFMVIMGLYVGLIDVIFSKVISLFLR